MIRQDLSAKKEKVEREIRQLENHQKIFQNRKHHDECCIEAHRLIEHRAILECVFLAVTGMAGEEVKAFLIGL